MAIYDFSLKTQSKVSMTILSVAKTAHISVLGWMDLDPSLENGSDFGYAEVLAYKLKISVYDITGGGAVYERTLTEANSSLTDETSWQLHLEDGHIMSYSSSFAQGGYFPPDTFAIFATDGECSFHLKYLSTEVFPPSPKKEYATQQISLYFPEVTCSVLLQSPLYNLALPASVTAYTTFIEALPFRQSYSPTYVTLGGLAEAPTGILLSSDTILENAPSSTSVGLLDATTVNGIPPLGFTYSILSGGDKFSLTPVPATLPDVPEQAELKSSVVFDYESATSHNVTIRCVGAGDLYYDQVLAVGVTNVAEAPSNLSLTSSTVPENSSVGTTVGTFVPTGGVAPFVYSLVSGTGSTDNSSFTVDGNALKVNDASFDFETKTQYFIRARAASGGESFDKELTITITNVNEVPTNVTLTSSTIAENNAVNAVIGTLNTTDPDAGNTFTYTILEVADHAAFNVNGNQLRASVSFDYENKSSYAITVRSTDQGGLFFDKELTITITNVSEGIDLDPESVDVEVLPSGIAIATVSVNPITSNVLLNGQPLPEGSVLRNSTDGQKFLKSGPGVNDFGAIEISPKTAWNLSEAGDAAWSYLQDK